MKPIQVVNETTERMVSDTCRDRFEHFKDAEGEYRFSIGQTLAYLHLLMPADPHEVHAKTNSQEVRYQLDISLITLDHVLTMFLSLPQCPDFSMLHIRRRGQLSV